MSYTNDFPPSWSSCELVIGSSLGVSTRKVVVEIGFATPFSKGKEKKGKKGAKEKLETKKDAEDLKVGQDTKKRKTSATSKRLPTSKKFREVAFAVIGGRSLSKEVSHPPILKIRVKTKVEIFKSQTLVSSLKEISSVAVSSPAQGSSGSPIVFPCSPEGPLGEPIVSRRLM